MGKKAFLKKLHHRGRREEKNVSFNSAGAPFKKKRREKRKVSGGEHPTPHSHVRRGGGKSLMSVAEKKKGRATGRLPLGKVRPGRSRKKKNLSSNIRP